MPVLGLDRGTGADGAWTLDGSAAPAGLTLAGSTYTVNTGADTTKNLTSLNIALTYTLALQAGYSLHLKVLGKATIAGTVNATANGQAGGGQNSAGSGSGAVGTAGASSTVHGSGGGGGGFGGAGGGGVAGGSGPGGGGGALPADLTGTWSNDKAGSGGGGGGTGDDDVTAGGPYAGGGGGAGDTLSTTGIGGSGVVIVSYITADFAVYTVTGGTITTNGTKTVHTFNTSGTFEIAPKTGVNQSYIIIEE